MADQKVSVYSLSELKNTTDDALPNYLTSLKFKQSHFLTDVRLGLGYSAVAIAGIAFWADHKLGWDATKHWTLLAVVAYFILNGALTYWIWGVEKGKVFTGEINDTLISIASSVNKHKPIYNLRVRYEKQGKKPQQLNISAPFTRWFDSDGFFVATPFQQWLASEIPVIGEADPKKVASSAASIESNKESRKVENAVNDTHVDPQPNGASPLTAARSRKTKKTHS
ncbi:MAG: hypothetical protein LQ350_002585 [Teloschistes chrysophthalmus]|nr:MAG: hypothetical protein LQ350_002585 [Niorma chrysophthalma]